MAAAIPFIVGFAKVASIATGIFSTISGLTKGKEKPPEQKPLPVAPTAEGAKTDAAEEVKKRRRSILNAGGQTDITRGSALLNPDAVNKKSLLGA